MRTMKKAPDAYNDLIIHPGETIDDVLRERGITNEELGQAADIFLPYIQNVIDGRNGITEPFAMTLEETLGVPKSFWINLQTNYEAKLKESKR